MCTGKHTYVCENVSVNYSMEHRIQFLSMQGNIRIEFTNYNLQII